MNSNTGADHPVIKAGCWFSTSGFPVQNINSKLFTHLYAGFAKVQVPIPQGGNINDVIIFPDSIIFQTFPKTVKRKNPHVKALLSIGSEGPNDISAIASVAKNEQRLRDAFINKSIRLARESKYDGLDLCWLYPSNEDQQDDLVSLLNDWRRAVDNDANNNGTTKLILTATVFHHPTNVPGTDGHGDIYNYYSVADLLRNLDWINVLAIDFYTPASASSPTKTGPVHAWLNALDKTQSGSEGIKDWIPNRDKDGQKFVLGLPFYGYKWILSNSNAGEFFAPARLATEPDLQRPVTFSNINEQIKNGNYETKYDSDYVATYAHDKQNGNWFGYDNETSISEKVEKAIGNTKLRGYLAWNVGGDDSKWTLSKAASMAADKVTQ